MKKSELKQIINEVINEVDDEQREVQIGKEILGLSKRMKKLYHLDWNGVIKDIERLANELINMHTTKSNPNQLELPLKEGDWQRECPSCGLWMKNGKCPECDEPDDGLDYGDRPGDDEHRAQKKMDKGGFPSRREKD